MISYDLKFFINYSVLKNIEIKIIWKYYHICYYLLKKNLKFNMNLIKNNQILLINFKFYKTKSCTILN